MTNPLENFSPTAGRLAKKNVSPQLFAPAPALRPCRRARRPRRERTYHEQKTSAKTIPSYSCVASFRPPKRASARGWSSLRQGRDFEHAEAPPGTIVNVTSVASRLRSLGQRRVGRVAVSRQPRYFSCIP